MSRTLRTLDELPINCRCAVERFHALYNQFREMGLDQRKHEVKLEAEGYIKALNDANLITTIDQRLLLCYITV